MSPDKQRIAIAEQLGFKWFAWIHTEATITISLNGAPGSGSYERKSFPHTRFLAPATYKAGLGEYECSDMSLAIDDECFRHVPDYLNDLNAMHEAVKCLDATQWPLYREYLAEVCTPLCQCRNKQQQLAFAMEATSSERAEALLRVLGLWESNASLEQEHHRRHEVLSFCAQEALKRNLIE